MLFAHQTNTAGESDSSDLPQTGCGGTFETAGLAERQTAFAVGAVLVDWDLQGRNHEYATGIPAN